MLSIALNGATGRMGQHIQSVIRLQSDLTLGTMLSEECWETSTLSQADAIIDFSLPAATMKLIEAMEKEPKPLVIGTTGFTQEERAKIEALAKKVPVVLSSNMSVGVNVFWKMLELGAKVLGSSSRITIEETHHIHKIDHPSGTAKTMMQIVSHAGKFALSEIVETLETPPTGNPRVSVVSHRKNEVIGDHSISFDTDGDTITLSHHAKDRRIFAEGSVVAARWIIHQPAGLYGMADVLGLSTL